ncbi:MAG: hypothetical protein FJ102_01105 [Deltaproteobacteria bacterium]|nr:hypothetical protein [Deltaproteobacteria bacterium]
MLALHTDSAPPQAAWLGMHDGNAVWAVPAESDLPANGAHVDIDLSPPLDEIGVPMGPDRDAGGLFDVETDSSVTGERTGVATEEAGIEQQRTALLTWIASSLASPAADVGDAGPCPGLKARIADEPPDGLPALAAPATSPRSTARALRAAPAAPAGERPEVDDTATAVGAVSRASSGDDTTTTGSRARDGITGTWSLAADRTLRTARWIALLLLALSAFAWWRLG